MDDLKQIVINKYLFRALSSAGYEHVGEVGEKSIYTNDEIKRKFIETISSQDTFKPILDTVIKLIELDIVVPTNIKHGLLDKIIYLFSRNKKRFAQSNFSMAFFDRESGKIFCLVENIDSIDYWNKSELLSLILLHEFQHMTATFFPTSFIRLNSKSLITYYKRFYELFFRVDVPDKNVFKIVNWVHNKLETTSGRATLTSNSITEYHNLMWNMLRPSYTNVSQLELDLHRFFKVLIIYLHSYTDYARALESRDIDCISIYLSLRDAYKSLKIMNRVDSLCIQELLAPSEVICIESEYNTQSRHFKLITQIKK